MRTDQYLGVMQFSLGGVREYTENYPVALWRRPDGRLVVVAKNEGGNNNTVIDLFELIEWLRIGPVEMRHHDGFFVEGGD